MAEEADWSRLLFSFLFPHLMLSLIVKRFLTSSLLL